jgi:ribonuclease P protein component
MISSTHRFHGRASIQRLYKNGKMVRSAYIGLRYAPNPRGTYRVGVVVSRKVNKSAVVRNRIRRRLYEHVRTLFSTSPPAFDVLITVFSEDLAALPAPVVRQEMENLFKKAQLTKHADS